MVAAGEAHPSAAIVSSYELNDRRVTGAGLAPNRELISGREACRLFLIGGVYMFGSPTTVLYRADVVRSRRPFFELGRLHEDTEVVFELLREYDFAFVHQVLTFTRVHADSISGAAQDFAPEALDRLILVKRFGREYLDDAEFEACLRQAERLYYGGLVRQWLTQPKRDFWRYHKQGLANAGERLRPHLIARHAGALVLESLLPPVVLRGVKKALDA
jgi:hypothetical protein